jgi:RNA polymerase sigma-70 factor (ECF subfamily)
VFVRLWQRPERFDPARGQLEGFLLRDAHGRAVDRLRSDAARRAREARHELDKERFERPADIEREVWDLIRSEKVKDALEQLSQRERDAITLAYFGGHTYREVASILEEPEGTIKGRIRLGLQKLASVLEASGMGARP